MEIYDIFDNIGFSIYIIGSSVPCSKMGAIHRRY